MNASAAPPKLGDRFRRALDYAYAVHRDDKRKGTDVPYLAHLLGVASLVLENGGNETETIGALLHDAAEDHGGEAQLEEIASRFGPEVEAIVRQCSDALPVTGQPKPKWFPRKEGYIAELARLSAKDEPVLLVSIADKLYNLNSIDADIRRSGGDDAAAAHVYQRFTPGKWGTLWYYRTLADVYARKDGRHRAILPQLNELVERLAPGLSSETLFERFRAEPFAAKLGVPA